MPLYDFECPACGHKFEDIARLEEAVTCPACSKSSPAGLARGGIQATAHPRVPGQSMSADRKAAADSTRFGCLVILLVAIGAVPFGLWRSGYFGSRAESVAAKLPEPWEEFRDKMEGFSNRYFATENGIQQAAVFHEARAWDKAFFAKTANVVTRWRGFIAEVRDFEDAASVKINMRWVPRKPDEEPRKQASPVFKQGSGILSPNRIKKGSPLYSAAAKLAVHDCVLFSGTVGPEEDSVSESGSMEEPEYEIVLTALEPCPK